MAAVDFAYKIVALAVMVIVIAAVALPVIDDFNNQTASENNTGYRYLMDETTASTVTLTATGFTVGTTAYTAADFNGYYIGMADDIILVYSGNTTTPKLQFIDFGAATLTNIEAANSTVTINNGSYTVAISGGATTTGDYVGDYKTLSSSGKYGLFRSGEVFFNDDSKFWFFTNTTYTIGGNSVSIRGNVTGTASELAYTGAINASASPMTTVSASDLAVTLTSTITEDGITNSLSSFDLSLDYSTGGSTYNKTTTDATYYITEISYDVNVDTGSAGTLISIIPVLLVITVIIFAVGLMRGKS